MSADALLPVDQAVRTVLDHVPGPRVAAVPLADAAGMVLAEEIRSDVDMPPYDRSMMDGYAVRAEDVADPPAELSVLETVHAGTLPSVPVGPGEASAIMTGAPVPEGADAVVMVERTEPAGEGAVRILESVGAGQNIAPRGQDVRVGDRVLAAGVPVRPEEVAVLATVGRAVVPVYARPTVAAFATGDEVVPPGERPGPGRIRNANSPALAARLLRDGAAAEDRGILGDDLAELRSALTGVLGRYDIVILTGGVSMGEKDLVGEALADLDFQNVFHKVRLKPGKPALFGTARGSLVFGLPGNPVSVAVTYELLVRPAVMKLSGRRPLHRPRVFAVLEPPAPGAIPREQYVPAVLRRTDEGLRVRRVPWHGSGDLFGPAAANAWMVVPAGGPAPREGERVEVMLGGDDAGPLLSGDGDA